MASDQFVTQYPPQSDFFAAVPVLISAFSGTQPVGAEAKAVWIAQGYAQGQVFPLATTKRGVLQNLSRPAMVAQLQAHVSSNGATAVNWIQLIQEIEAIIAALLAGGS